MSDVNVAVVYGANGLEFTKTEQTLPLTLNVVANGIVGPAGPTGPTGPTGATGPAGPAPAGTGLVSVTGGVLDTPSTLSARVAADAANLRTQLGLGTVATQDANNVTLTGGTLQGVGVVTGSYTSNVNEALLRSCRKASAGTITKGQVVYITGSTGSHLEVELADADTEPTSSKTFGVAAETITASTEGYVIVEGLLTGLSNLPTASFTNGDSLWLSSTAGGWQTTPPADPANGVYLGRVINASNGNNGSAFVRIQNGYELDELHDVAISTPLDTHSLFYETSSGLWKNRRPALSDISQSSATTGQFTEWNGSAWVPSSITASDISDSTVAGRAILTAADAPAQRTALGLDSAALRADTDFPRFDSDQSATATQKRTARRNIGFSDSFTTAELLALGATESAKLRVAFCSDCFASGADMQSIYGDMCFWNGYQWINQSDNVPISANGITGNDWVMYALNKARMCSAGELRPTASVHGDTANPVLSITGYTSGAGASVAGQGAGTDRLIQISATPGSTSTGSFRALPIFGANALSATAPVRKIAVVLNYVPTGTAVSNIGTDNWYWKFGLGLAVFSASATLTADEIAFVMDDVNTLGQGATGSSLYALCRLNGTTLDWVSTSVNPIATNKFLIATWEPTGPLQREGRARLSVADDLGANLTTIVDRSGVYSGAITTMQPYLAGAKTLGTATRFTIRKFMRCVTYRTNISNGGVIS